MDQGWGSALVLLQTDFWGVTISSKWCDSQLDEFPEKRIIRGNFQESMPGTRRFHDFPQLWFILWKFA